MKRSTKYLLSTTLFLASSASLYWGIKDANKLKEPIATQEVKTYNFLTESLKQTKEPASNEFKKNYIQNINKIQANNPDVAQQTKQFNQAQSKYVQKKNQSLGLQFSGLLGIIGSYVLLCSAGKPSTEEFSNKNDA